MSLNTAEFLNLKKVLDDMQILRLAAWFFTKNPGRCAYKRYAW